ncbi:MAG: NUDIX hydrolase [Deltaproteobacteria bacterium]|nr:NUDIX hydrolase [Deltaproteobacteria bacterium]
MNSTTSKTVLKNAATVILIRPSKAGHWEIFLARRHQNQNFMAGAYVFPGGQLEEADSDPHLEQHIKTSDVFHPGRLLRDESLPREKALGFFIAAIRETFEETGILLGGKTIGNYILLNNKETIQKFNQYRIQLNAFQITLAEIVRKEEISFFPEALIPYSHWITPEFVKKRFSTRFFLAKLPPGQTPVADAMELAESLWITPQNALEMNRQKEIILMPPTLKTTEELSAFRDIDELFSAAKTKTIYPILPQLAGNILKLPHDPEYSIKDYKRPPKPDEPSRILSENGVWKTAFYK